MSLNVPGPAGGEAAIRILFVSDSIREPLTGVGRVALTLLRHLVAAGHEAIPLDWRHNEAAARVAGRCEVVPPRLPWAKTALWHLELLRRLPRVAHDVLLNPSGYPNALGQHPRLICWVHDLHMLTPGFYRPWKSTWFRLWQPLGLRKAHALVCPSAFTRTQVLRRYPVHEDRCVVVPNAIDTSFLPPAGEPAAREPYLLAVGTIEDRKNVHRLAEAYAQCRAAGCTVPLWVVGKPGHGSRLFLRRIHEPDLRGAVRLLGDVPDAELAELYRGALALLFPSLEEGFGLPILEAMQAGTPVLTSKVSATAEVAGDAALLVDPMDTGSIRDGIARLMEDPALREDLRRRGRERVRQFDAGVQARALERLMAVSS